jgi:dTDP-4-dehydrorhamnose reductase
MNKIAEKFSFDKKFVEEASSDTLKSQFKRPKNTTLSISKLKKTIINCGKPV